MWDIVRTRYGPENAIRQKVLAQMLHNPVREIRIITLSLLEKKYPIGSTTHRPYGVYRIEGTEDRDTNVASLKSRAFETLYRARLIEALFWDGQMRLF